MRNWVFQGLRSFVFVTMVLVSADSAWSAQQLYPFCDASGQNLPVNNAMALKVKATAPNQFKTRAHVAGILSKVYADATGHGHFSIQIGQHADETVEIIYNEEFGALPDKMFPGMKVEACGDLITASAQAGPYPPSPDGAILHWVHFNPSPQGHPSGYLVVNGRVYGQQLPARQNTKR